MAGGEGMNSTDYLRSINRKLDILISCVCPPEALEGLSASGAVGKAAKKEKKEKDPSAPKRPLASGTAAWMAYIKHLKEARPERFEGVKTQSEALAIAKVLRAENEAEYERFVADFVSRHPELSSNGSGASAGKAPAIPHQTKELNEETGLTRLTIDGQKYWLSAEGNEVWRRNAEDELGAWVGYYQPDNAANPIRPTNAPNNAGGGGRRRKTRKTRKTRKS
jgi:hypothetical protein